MTKEKQCYSCASAFTHIIIDPWAILRPIFFFDNFVSSCFIVFSVESNQTWGLDQEKIKQTWRCSEVTPTCDSGKHETANGSGSYSHHTPCAPQQKTLASTHISPFTPSIPIALPSQFRSRGRHSSKLFQGEVNPSLLRCSALILPQIGIFFIMHFELVIQNSSYAAQSFLLELSCICKPSSSDELHIYICSEFHHHLISFLFFFHSFSDFFEAWSWC